MLYIHMLSNHASFMAMQSPKSPATSYLKPYGSDI